MVIFHRKEREDIMINFGKKIVKHRKLVIIKYTGFVWSGYLKRV